LLAVGAASAQTVTSKREQAQAILAEVQQLDSDLEQTVEAWHYANIELNRIDADLASNARHLVAAKKSLVIAQKRIEKRLRDLYVNGSGDSTLEVLLGARSLDDVIARLDAIERVSHQDASVLAQVKRFRKEVETRRANLQKARADQARIVAERAAQKSSIESRLAEREQMLASVRDEIVQLQAEERARQARLAAEARARLRAQELAAQQATTADNSYSEALADAVYDPNVPAARYSQVVGIALQYLGIPYVWGGASPSAGFDCSGFVQYIYAQVGVYLPHHAASQYNYGVPVSREQLAPRRPRLLRRARPCRDLHRRRPIRPRAAHGRRGQDLEPVRQLVRVDLVRRAADPLGPSVGRRPKTAVATRRARRSRPGSARRRLGA
jgi:cell wall-associated NlpC family hydrolase